MKRRSKLGWRLSWPFAIILILIGVPVGVVLLLVAHEYHRVAVPGAGNLVGSPSAKDGVLSRLAEKAAPQPGRSRSYFDEPGASISFSATLDARQPSPLRAGRGQLQGLSIAVAATTTATTGTHAAKSAPVARVDQGVVNAIMPTAAAAAAAAKTTRTKKKGSGAGFRSRIELRQGRVWSDPVRPGCVYWWCYPHPLSFAPSPSTNTGTSTGTGTGTSMGSSTGSSSSAAVYAPRPHFDPRWVDAMAKRYPEHATRIHRNKTVYYTESKHHFDLSNVAFGPGGKVHVFLGGGDSTEEATLDLLNSKLVTWRQAEAAAKHKQEQGTKKGSRQRGGGGGNSAVGNKSPGGGGGGEQRRLPCYESVDKKAAKRVEGLCPPITVHHHKKEAATATATAASFDVSRSCKNGAVLERTLFFLAPHYPGNFFHLVNDNLVPLVSEIQATPGCDPLALTCQGAPPLLAQFWSDPHRKAGGANAWWEALFGAVFGSGGDKASSPSPPSGFGNITADSAIVSAEDDVLRVRRGGGGEGASDDDGVLLCVRRVSWGMAPRPFYTDFVKARFDALQALRKKAFEALGVVDPGPSLALSAGSWAEPPPPPTVVFIKRYKKSKEQNPRGGAGDTYNRVLGDPHELVAGFKAHGMDVLECCDFKSMGIGEMVAFVSKADVVVSLHGAGLINGLFARAGATLVELHGTYGCDDVIFRRLAQGRKGGYMKVRVDEGREAHRIGLPRAQVVAACALRLYRGVPCESHPDLEEAYRPQDMWNEEWSGRGESQETP